MSPLVQWAAKWGVPPEALGDLVATLNPPATAAKPDGSNTEADVQHAIRLRAQALGGRLWRNNVGAAVDQRGHQIRYGLANESATVNKMLKSADLIGCIPVQVGPEEVGHTIGRFVSIEVKEPGWQYRGTPREVAQNNWRILVQSLGGVAEMTANGEVI